MKFIVSLNAGPGIEICTHGCCLNEFYFAHCLTAFCLQVVRMESDFQICEMASDITCSISKYWKQVNEISDEGAFGISTPLSRRRSEARRSSCSLFITSSVRKCVFHLAPISVASPSSSISNSGRRAHSSNE